MNVITDAELRARMVAAFLVGAVAAAGASALLYRQLYNPPSAPAGTPEIVLQTPSQTVARIPTRNGEKRVDCTVTIDQAKNVWSITC